MAYIGFGVDPVLFSFISLKLQDEWNLSALEYGIIPSVNGVFSTFAGPCFTYASDLSNGWNDGMSVICVTYVSVPWARWLVSSLSLGVCVCACVSACACGVLCVCVCLYV